MVFANLLLGALAIEMMYKLENEIEFTLTLLKY